MLNKTVKQIYAYRQFLAVLDAIKNKAGFRDQGSRGDYFRVARKCGDVSTEIEDNTSTNAEINIMVEESDNTIRVITNGVELKTIYVSDMSGRTMKYNVRGCAVHLKLPISEGVYLVNVIGDTASRTGKVILK